MKVHELFQIDQRIRIFEKFGPAEISGAHTQISVVGKIEIFENRLFEFLSQNGTNRVQTCSGTF